MDFRQLVAEDSKMDATPNANEFEPKTPFSTSAPSANEIFKDPEDLVIPTVEIQSIPDHLIQEIERGNCIAFVGSGFRFHLTTDNRIFLILIL